MEFDTKIAVVVRDDLAVWQKLNVVAFLAGGLAGSTPEIVGLPYEDASGNTYKPLINQPIMVYTADRPGIKRAFERAINRGITPALYTNDLFDTGNDNDNRAAVKSVSFENLDLVGIAIRGIKKGVDKALDGLKLHS